MRPTFIDILRHGEPVGGRRYRGQIDDPLSEKGWAEMRAAVAEVGPPPWQALVSSPLARCRAFAEQLAVATGLSLAFDDRLKEVGFGSWEGRTAAEINAAEPGSVLAFKRDPVGNRPAGAEPLDAFQARVATAFDDLVQHYTGQHVLLIAHAGVIRMAISHVLGLPAAHGYRIQVGSAAMARFRIDIEDGQAHRMLMYLTPGQGAD